MRILSAELHDYLSFRDCPPIEFREGINLVVGVNNSGKSSLLKAMVPMLPAVANRDGERYKAEELPAPSVTLRVRTTGKRFEESALINRACNIPVRGTRNAEEEAREFFQKSFLNLSFEHHGGGSFERRYPGHGLFAMILPVRPDIRSPKSLVAFINQNGKLISSGVFPDAQDSTPDLLLQIYNEDVYYFSPERLSKGEGSFQNTARLDQDASNLPAFLHTLAGERADASELLKEHLQTIFPTFGNFTVRTKPGTAYSEILIWPTKERLRPGLGFPLNASGTGLGQVMAILGAVMTTTESVIIIDEINTFLHAGAVKALLRLFQTEYSHHQYIISTHSPEVISFSNPSTVHLVSREGYRSRVTALDLEKIDDLREVSRQLGFSMADVFSADQIIWVEGPSEELCFPLLYQAFAQRLLPPTTKILSVVTTGDFLRKRDRALIWEIYESLSRKATPLVSNVKFSFDSEKMDDKAKDDLIQEAGSALNFLPRRHLECYLIDPPSIAEFIRERDECLSDDSKSRLIDQVTNELMRLAAEKEFCVKKWNGNLNDKAWLSIVDAANLIKGVCNTVSQCRVSFHKNRDSLRLLQLVIKNNRTQVQELGEYVQQLVDRRA